MSMGWIEDVVKDGKVVLQNSKAEMNGSATSSQAIGDMVKGEKVMVDTQAIPNGTTLSV